jgi:hypothetical protein
MRALAGFQAAACLATADGDVCCDGSFPENNLLAK